MANNTNIICKNVFKNYDKTALAAAFTLKWIEIINQYEKNKGKVVPARWWSVVKKVNNAIIENRNKIIKCIKNNANGYTNWNRFHNRVMYVLDPKATFSLEPKEEK